MPLLLHRKSPVPGRDQITAAKLAVEIGIEPARIQPLIDHGYLRIMAAGLSLETTIVARPQPAAMTWLKTLFTPLRMRPMLPVEEVSGLLNLTPAELRSFIVHYNIPLYHDPVFGELMTINGLRAVQRGTYAERRTARYDTQAMLLFLTKQDGITWNPRHHSYWEQLDREIQRICALPEPDRTMRAVALWTAWRDANTFRDCLAKYRERYLKAVDVPKSSYRKTAEKRMDLLEQGINGTISGRLKMWRLPPIDKSQIPIKKVKEKVAPDILKEIRVANRERALQEKLAALGPEAPWWAATAVKYHHARGR